jgi:hypothetical protein
MKQPSRSASRGAASPGRNNQKVEIRRRESQRRAGPGAKMRAAVLSRQLAYAGGSAEECAQLALDALEGGELMAADIAFLRSASFTTTKAGTFHWVASYSGDSPTARWRRRARGKRSRCCLRAEWITAARVSSAHHRASFTFSATGASRFECALVKQPAGTPKTKPKPNYRSCISTKTYRHLRRGRYMSYVRAMVVGRPGPAATKGFRIAQPIAGRLSERSPC